MAIETIGVVGAGAMGAGIAYVFSAAGRRVLLTDVSPDLIGRGLSTMRGVYQGRVDKGKMTAAEMAAGMTRVMGVPDARAFTEADFVIEAVPEKLDLKRSVFQTLDRICRPDVVLATNTSALPVSGIGAGVRRPGRVAGMHFFNPVQSMKLVEVIPGIDTSSETVDAVFALACELDKEPVVVQECPGFLVNRLLFPYLNEAVLALCEGGTSPAEIDATMTTFGWPMGPCHLMDTIGIDVCMDILDPLARAYGQRMAPAPLLAAMVAAGRLGVKTDAGFYVYNNSGAEPIERLLAGFLPANRPAQPVPLRPDRLLLRMINEAVLCLTEHIAPAADIDQACIAGLGMRLGTEPVGPLRLADQMGIDVVVRRLEAFQAQYGERFLPAYHLRTLVGARRLGRTTGRGIIS